MPIIERKIRTEGDYTQAGVPLIKRTVIQRTYVPAAKVRKGDIVVKLQDCDVTEEKKGKKGRVTKVRRTVPAVTEKELQDPRVRADYKLEPLEVVDEDDDDLDGPGTRVQDEEEEIDEEEEEEEIVEEEEDETLLERFVQSDWKDAVAIVGEAKKAGDTTALSEMVAAEMRRSKPRPSIVKAFVDAGLGEPSDFVKAGE